ncbi:MAG: 3-oxoacyl-ACP synthase III family protein [Acidimicrobiia bacterium]
MTATIRSRITGVGSYVPPRVVTNDELTAFMDTSDRWIQERTGIRTRHWVDPETSTSDLALQAARRALDDAGSAAEDMDMIILATLSPDHQFPGTACFLQAKMDLGGIPAIDVRQQCTGFIYSMAIADQFIRTGTYRKVLVVGAEVHSKGLDLSTAGRDVSVLFGDGAGAVVVQAVDVVNPEVEPHVIYTDLHADGSFAQELWLAAPGMAYSGGYVEAEALQRGEHYPRMNGRTVFVNAVKRMTEVIGDTLDATEMKLEEIDLFVFHQANQRISEAVAGKLGITPDRMFNTIADVGNTTAASIPIGMDRAAAAGVLRPGMLVACVAFGSGFTWGSLLLRW